MMLNFTHWLNQALLILFPPACCGCEATLSKGQTGGALCNSCLLIFSTPEAFTCPECRGRVPRPEIGLPPIATLCHPKAGYLLLACASYHSGPVQNSIRRLKFEHNAGLTEPLGKAAARALCSSVPKDTVIVAIPLGSQRLRERGFNQSELIASVVAGQTGLPHQTANLIRVKNTEAQTKIKTWREREKNLRDVFAVATPQLIEGKNVILVDDVWTSGATMKDAVRALREAGAKRIIGLVLCRAS